MSSSGSEFFSIKALTLHYGANLAVDRLNLSMSEGETVALLGPSGCGKTTTMRAVAGLLQPSTGQVVLAGRDITTLAANLREIGLVFQSYALFPHLNVFDNVAFGLRLRGVGKAEMTQRVGDALTMVGLPQFAKRLPKELSGGQQQRVALARTVVVRPRLLLLDEPLSNLDTRLRLEMRTELKRMQRELGITMIVVTHDQLEALALADRVAVMREGVLVQLDTPQAVYERPASVFVAQFMGMDNIISRDSASQQVGLFESELARSFALAWRPQSVVLGRGPHQGAVMGASYLGDSVEVLLDTPLGPIKAQTTAQAMHRAGDRLAFDLPLAAAVRLSA